MWCCLIIKFEADATFTKHAPLKVYCIKPLRNVSLNLKGQGSLNFKKYQATDCQIISCRLIPLKTHVSFRCTVPLSKSLLYTNWELYTEYNMLATKCKNIKSQKI
jgi:hypothetical protein